MSLIATTIYGPVEGFEENGIRRWLGIPFAAPPVGERRYRRAQPPEPWTEARPCKAMGSSPVQFAAGPMADMMVLNAPMSEDCLYLNVWAPENAKGAPVFVYIYGGANHMGESAAPDHDLSAFASARAWANPKRGRTRSRAARHAGRDGERRPACRSDGCPSGSPRRR